MPKAYGYCRASTAGQQYTFEAQRKAITAHYDSRLKDEGYEWGGFFEDKATSGAKPLTEREQGLKLWVTVQPGDIVIWSKLDRASRCLFDTASILNMFKTKGVGLVSLDIALDTSTALGTFVIHLLGAVAELEREWIRQRTKEALAIRQEKGLPHGGRPPAGWMRRTDGTWDHDKTERKLIEWIVQTHDVRGWSYDRIVAFLKRMNVRRANGDRYHQPWIHYALKARAAGYPGRDGWRDKVTRERRKDARELVDSITAVRPSSPEGDPDTPSAPS